jgi:DNA-directed RNA polymerase specialized sigma24 family protein
LFALVVRMVPDRDQASDVVQEAFFSAYRNLSSFRGGSVRSWLNRIAVNAAMDLSSRKARRSSHTRTRTIPGSLGERRSERITVGRADAL